MKIMGCSRAGQVLSLIKEGFLAGFSLHLLGGKAGFPSFLEAKGIIFYLYVEACLDFPWKFLGIKIFCSKLLCTGHLVTAIFFTLQNAAAPSQTQTMPAMTQAPPQSGGTMGYMGNQSVPMGYQPYNMQVRKLFQLLCCFLC